MSLLKEIGVILLFMGIVQRQGILASIGNYLGVILGYLNMVIFYPNVLGADEFGLVRLLIATSAVLSQFGEMGLSAAAIRYFPKFRSSKELKAKLFGTILFAASAIAFALVFVMIGLRDEINLLFNKGSSLFNSYYSELIIMTIGIGISEVLFGIARAQLKNITPVFIRELLLRIFQSSLILAFYLDFISFDSFCLAFAIAYPCQGLLMLGILSFQKRIALSWFNGNEPDSKTEIYKYAGYMALMKIPNYATVHIDVIMLGALADLKSVAIYSIAVFLANLIMLPARTINQIALPVISRDLAAGNSEKVTELFSQSVRTLVIVSGTLFLVINVSIEAIQFFTHIEGIEHLAQLTLILGLGKLINAASGISWGILNQSNHYKRSFIISVAFITCAVTLNFLLIPSIGMEGAAIATCLSFLFYSIVKLVAIKKWLKISTSQAIPIGVILVLVLLVFALNLIDLENVWISVALRSAVGVSLVLMALIFTPLFPELSKLVLKFVPFKLKK